MIRNQVVDPLFPQCPVRNVLSRIGDRWSLLVLLALHEKAEAMRFSDLCKAIPDVADDLLSRTIYPEVPPRVEYKLTKRGKTLIPLLNQLVDWSLDNMDAIIRHREKYEL